MNPRFDLESDHNFLQTLLDIGPTVPEEFFGEVQVISASKSWPQFCDDHHWREHHPPAIDGYPGTPPYHVFDMTLESVQPNVYGIWIAPANIICVLGVTV